MEFVYMISFHLGISDSLVAVKITLVNNATIISKSIRQTVL